jgi:hypothetical protein
MEILLSFCMAITFFLGMCSFELLRDPEVSRPVAYALSIICWTASAWCLIQAVT